MTVWIPSTSFGALEVIRSVRLCILEAVEGEIYLLEVLGVMRCVLPCMPEAMEGGLYLLEALEAMRCVLLCILGAMEGGLYLLEGVGGAGGCEGEFCMLEVLEVLEELGGDAPRAGPYAGDCGG